MAAGEQHEKDQNGQQKEARNRQPKKCDNKRNNQVGMNGDTFSIKAPKECSKKFAATFKGKFLPRGNALRIFSLFLEDFGAPL